MGYIDNLLTDHGVDHKEKGNDYVVRCLNPEHEDHNPSMNIDMNTGRFNCLSCGYGGGIAKLLTLIGAEAPAQHMFLAMKVDKIREQIYKIRMQPPAIPDDAKPYEGRHRDLKKSTYTTHAAFTSIDPTWNYRICFPIYNNYKELVFIEGRSTDTDVEPKYMRQPAGAEINFLYNVNCGAPALVLVEGWFDYLNMYDLGIRNVCPLFGLNFNKFMLKEAKMRGVQTIISMLDNDPAGNNASGKIKNICFASNLTYRRVLPGTDPGDISSMPALKAILKHNKCKINEGFMV